GCGGDAGFEGDEAAAGRGGFRESGELFVFLGEVDHFPEGVDGFLGLAEGLEGVGAAEAGFGDPGGVAPGGEVDAPVVGLGLGDVVGGAALHVDFAEGVEAFGGGRAAPGAVA